MPESCLPNPICQNSESTFYNLDKVQVNGSLYDGNATAYDWVGEFLRSYWREPAGLNTVNSGEIIATDVGTRLLLKQENSERGVSTSLMQADS